MHVTIVTAGGAGMFCGSCLHDNLWARALRREKVDATLLPLYTPIRVDDQDHTSTPIFYGGINVYLDQHLPGWRYLPSWMTRVLNSPGVLRWATKHGVSNNAAELGSMTVSMLKGPRGPQAREGAQLTRYLSRELRPDVVIFSNIMLASEIERLKKSFKGPVLCVLQGDDVFLDALHEPWKSQAFELLKPIVQAMDGFLFHSQFYSDYMGSYLQIPAVKRHLLPLAVDCSAHDGTPRGRNDIATIGYFARLAPEKGLKEFVEGALELNRRRQDFRVEVGGYLPSQHQAYVDEVTKLATPLGRRFQYRGSPDGLPEKIALLKSFDLLSVPTPYQEPKGLYVLEAWANGVPVVQPAHGHFPELVAGTGGGLIVAPGDPVALADGWERLLDDEPQRLKMARSGWEQVRLQHDLPILARQTKERLTELGVTSASS